VLLQSRRTSFLGKKVGFIAAADVCLGPGALLVSLLLLFDAAKPSVSAGTLRITVPARRFVFFFVLPRAFTTVATPVPDSLWRLFKVDPAVSEALAVVTLRQASLSHLGFYFNEDVGAGHHAENSLCLPATHQGHKEEE
jgi:hypothetical protein